MSHESTFTEIAAILSLASILGIIGQKLRQPLLIMFLATGILAGPAGLGIIQSYQQIELLAHIGIALLLFIVGLKLDLGLIKTTGSVALATGLGQIIFTSAIGFFIAIALGMSTISAAYVAVALTFSSTIIVVKLLSDKKEIDSLHGQIAVGFLIVQDIAAILALVGLITFGSPLAEAESVSRTSLFIAAKGFGMLGLVALLMKFILPGLTRRLAHSQEMLILFAIAWAVFWGAASEWLGFTKEVGAFLAGVSLASTGYRDAIGARLTSLRDFLLLFFFIDLGARLDWSAVGSQLGASFLFSLFVLIGNPLIVLAIMGIMGYRRRTGFMAGLTVAQISEFSLIVASLGLSLGHISREIMGLITLVGVVTIFFSTYLILYAGPLYHFFSRPLKIFEKQNPYREAAVDSQKQTHSVDVILSGLGNYGSALAECLVRRHRSVIGVDFDPIALRRWRDRGIPVLYGDMADPEIQDHLPLSKARWVVSTVRSKELNQVLVQQLKNSGYSGKMALTAVDPEEATRLKKQGIHVVLRPFSDAAEQAADSLTHAMDFLPENIDWPITFMELRIRSDATVAGQTLKNIPLTSITGVTILAISRAGRVNYDPGSDFQIYPGDRLVLMGPPEGLKEAEALFNAIEIREQTENKARFEIAEIRIAPQSKLAGQTLTDLRFRQKYGVTVVGIRRGDEQITTINPGEKIFGEDCLIIVGTVRRIAQLQHEAPL